MRVVTGRELLDFTFRLHLRETPRALHLLCLQSAAASPSGPHAVSLTQIRREVDKYTDTLLLLEADPNDAEGPIQVRPMLGTISPGAFYTQTDPHPLGAANLTYGEHLYVRGPHRGRPALRALGDQNRVWRDRDGDFVFDLEEQIYVGAFGVNIHPGGRSDYIGRWSAGCINVAGGWESADWKALMSRVDVREVSMSRPLHVTVWRASDLFRWLGSTPDARPSFRPTIHPGHLGLWTLDIQNALNAHGHHLRADGDWRGATTEAVLAFQRDQGLKADGIVGPRTWSALVSPLRLKQFS